MGDPPFCRCELGHKGTRGDLDSGLWTHGWMRGWVGGGSKRGVCDPEWPSAREHVGLRESVQLGRCAWRVCVRACPAGPWVQGVSRGKHRCGRPWAPGVGETT